MDVKSLVQYLEHNMRPVNISYYFLFQFQENWYLVQGIQRRSYRVCSLLLLKKWSEGRKCDSNIIYLQKGVCCFSVGWMGWNQIFPGATANKCCPSFGRCRNSCKGQGFRGLASGTGSVQMSLVGWGGGGFCWVAASWRGQKTLCPPSQCKCSFTGSDRAFCSWRCR